MSLLDDIIKAITETDEKISSILRKCLVLPAKSGTSVGDADGWCESGRG